jgi:fructan beta-fructosidase
MSNWDYANIVPTENWRSAMTIARELLLTEVNGKIRLVNKPLDNYKNQLSKNSYNWEIKAQDTFLIKQASEWTEINFKNSFEDDQNLEISFYNDNSEELLFNINFEEKLVSIDRSLIENHNFSSKFQSVQKAPINFNSDQLKVEIYKDASSLEIFINEGELVMTALYFSEKDLNRMKITSNKNITADIKASDFDSIW